MSRVTVKSMFSTRQHSGTLILAGEKFRIALMWALLNRSAMPWAADAGVVMTPISMLRSLTVFAHIVPDATDAELPEVTKVLSYLGRIDLTEPRQFLGRDEAVSVEFKEF